MKNLNKLLVVGFVFVLLCSMAGFSLTILFGALFAALIYKFGLSKGFFLVFTFILSFPVFMAINTKFQLGIGSVGCFIISGLLTGLFVFIVSNDAKNKKMIK